jgi:adenylosuccinate lyase
MDKDASLYALSPLDGRYVNLTTPLRDYFSEAALITYRVEIEVKYLIALSEIGIIPKIKPLSSIDIHRVKDLENQTHHDVKAVEYYLREVLPSNITSFIHFALTSEDINNLAYRLMIKNAHNKVVSPILKSTISNLKSLIINHASLPILARTHGQAAVPTTLGKEFAVFGQRLLVCIQKMQAVELSGKLNGAVGNYQAHHLVFPEIDWTAFSRNFIKSLNLSPNDISTQINPADDIIELLQHYQRFNNILISLCQDIWRYISDDWLVQLGKDTDVGSSTMPQKINPIEFENAEGNLTLANGIIETMIRKLSISRLQRDLSDSTIMRNLGTVFGYSLIAYHSLNRGLKTLTPNPTKITADLNANYAILGEALQTYLRAKGQADAYESVAKQFKQKQFTQSDWQTIAKNIAPELSSLTPQTYIGYAEKLALSVAEKINQHINRHPGLDPGSIQNNQNLDSG